MQARCPQAIRILKSRVADCTGVVTNIAVLNRYWKSSTGAGSLMRFRKFYFLVTDVFGIGAGPESKFASSATLVWGRL